MYRKCRLSCSDESFDIFSPIGNENMTSQNFEVAGAKGSHPTAKLEIEIKVCVVDMPPSDPGWIKKKLVTDSVFLVLPTRIQWWIGGGMACPKFCYAVLPLPCVTFSHKRMVSNVLD